LFLKKIVFNKVFNHPSVKETPPVLLDIGASGDIHKEWRSIAKYCICLAFDADDRDFNISEKDNQGYKKLYTINRVVSDKNIKKHDFYLTKSPHCSSSLKPLNNSLKDWNFSYLFEIVDEVKVPSCTLSDVLKDCNLDRIDWYKSDSQGTDLRIFRTLSRDLQKKMLVCEFEPGIIDAYTDEDKLISLMKYLENLPFWVCDMVIKGSQRIKIEDRNNLSYFQRKHISSFLKFSPCYCEISYISDFSEFSEIRSTLIGWVFAIIKKQYGFALHLARLGKENTNDDIFNFLYKVTPIFLISGYPVLMKNFLKKVFFK